MITSVFRTVRFNVKNAALQQACKAQCLASKNLKNSGLFVVRNVLSSFDAETKQLKAELNDHQVEVLGFVNQSIDIINERRTDKNQLKAIQLQVLTEAHAKGAVTQAEFDAQSKKLKPGKLFVRLDAKASAKDAWSILDDTVLDQVLRTRVDNLGQMPFRALPAKASEQVRKQISAEYSSWIESLKSFKGDGANHTGRPRMPGYMGKNDLNPVKYFAGVLGVDKLPTLKDRALFLDYAKTQALPDESMKAYQDFDLGKAREMLRNQLPKAKRSSPDQAQLVELRIIPKGRAGFEQFFIEGVFECKLEIADTSVLARFMQKAQEQKISADKLQVFYAKEISSVASEVVLAGADPGLNNLIALSFSHGHQGVIVSNARLERKTALFDAKLDVLKNALVTARLRELQKRQDELKTQNAKLPEAEFTELRTLQRAVFDNPKLQAVLDDRQAWLKNALHTTSCGIVKLLVERGVQALIVGKNKGWKTDTDFSHEQNRRFYASSHAKLIELLRYKCEDAGILLIETEESYTSKTSFACAVPLKNFKDKDKGTNKSKNVPPTNPSTQTGEQQIDPLNAVGELNQTLTPSTKPLPCKSELRAGQHLYGGVRRPVKGAKSKAKHQFVSTHPSGASLGRWSSIHADMNAAYNIIRKLVPTFQASDALSTRFDLMWVSPSGITRFKTKSKYLNREWTAGGVQKLRDLRVRVEVV